MVNQHKSRMLLKGLPLSLILPFIYKPYLGVSFLNGWDEVVSIHLNYVIQISLVLNVPTLVFPQT